MWMHIKIALLLGTNHENLSNLRLARSGLWSETVVLKPDHLDQVSVVHTNWCHFLAPHTQVKYKQSLSSC